MMKIIFNIIYLLVSAFAFCQFAPGASQTGTTAIYKDSSIFINWASEIIVFNPGPEDLTNNQSPIVSFGVPNNATGQAEGNSFETVSLGDGGSIILGFEYPIINSFGPDFAVFENSFSETYLEFAFVEVSTNGVDFVRFPATSNTQSNTQTGAFDSTDPTLVNNLAGKYSQGYGVPFDLNELVDSSTINVDSISFIRLVDVVGSIDSAYGTFDSQANFINDPFPSPFNSSGFDLDAIGVINQNNPLNVTEHETSRFIIYPNPANNSFKVNSELQNNTFSVFTLQGQLLLEADCNTTIDCTIFANGIYFVSINNNENHQIQRIVVSH